MRRAARAVAALLVAGGVATFVLIVVRHDERPAKHVAKRTTAPVAGSALADPGLVTQFLSGAASDIAAVTSYDYRSLDDALTAGLAVTTGAYQRAYRAALTGDLAATARADHAVHTFDALKIGIGEMNAAGTQAKVLVFGVEHVTDDATGATPTSSPVTLCATIQRQGNRFLISDLVEGANAGLPPGGPELRVAAEAARAEVVSLLTYRRDQFDSDVQAALAGATGTLAQQIRQNAADTKAAMTRGKYDLSGAVTAVAVESTATDRVVMLMAATSSRVPDSGATPDETPQRYEVTVERPAGHWLVSEVTSVDGS